MPNVAIGCITQTFSVETHILNKPKIIADWEGTAGKTMRNVVVIIAGTLIYQGLR